MLGEVLGEEEDDEDVGRGDEDEDDAGEDCKIFVDVARVPDEDRGEVENEIQRQSRRHCRGQYMWTQIEPAGSEELQVSTFSIHLPKSVLMKMVTTKKRRLRASHR